MKILWLDINSSYSHSSMALPAIHAQVRDNSEWEWSVVRGTINDNPGKLATSVAAQRPDIIAATFWLFTHNMQIEVLSRVVELLDDVRIVCGGPEFLGGNEDFLKKNSFVTAVIRGEGEQAFPKLLSVIEDQSQWHKIEGLCWISDKYHDNGVAKTEDFAALQYPEKSQFFNWDKPFVQLETTRGCFNTCAFCVSGGEKPVRVQTLEQVRERLKNIYEHGIKDIRILDRTFNHDTERACEMLDIFSGYDGKMRFHLEIHPSLISERLKTKIASLPKGLLHLEAGIQSLDTNVLAESGRKGSLQSSLDGLKFLCSQDNLQTHADLIIGLPGYTLDQLCDDINKLSDIGVDELQVESLKILPGTMFRRLAHSKGLKYSPLPPYEILKTPDMSSIDIIEGLKISRTIDFYYNCSSWQGIVRKLIRQDSQFIRRLTSYLDEKIVLDSPLSLERRGVLLYEFICTEQAEFASEMSIAWISAGCSLKKKPAGEITKIKNIDTLIKEKKIDVRFGEMSPTHRYYLLRTPKCDVLFGYDSSEHLPSPVFMAYLS